MFQFFDGIASVIGTVVHFVVSVVNMIVFVLTQIPVALAFIVKVVAYLPTYVQTFVLLFAGTCIIFNILNKGD